MKIPLRCYSSKPSLPLWSALCGKTMPNLLFVCLFVFTLLSLGHQPDRSGELDHCHTFGVRIPFCKEAWQRGHGPAPEEPDQEPRSEDRHGQQNEEDGRVTAVRGQRPEEQEGHRKPGTIYLHEYFLPWLTPLTAHSGGGGVSSVAGGNSFCGFSLHVLSGCTFAMWVT